jgi:hypothetical protein
MACTSAASKRWCKSDSLSRASQKPISTFAVSGANLAARVQTETNGQADTPAILAKRINNLPNRVLGVQAHGEPVPIPSKQEGVTRLKIPIIVFVDQKGYAQEAAELATTLDKLALQRVTGQLKQKGVQSAGLAESDARIWPGLRTHPGMYTLQISTSWTGDVYADIETEMLPRLKSVKLSVKWSGPNGGTTDADQRTEEYLKEHLRQRNAPSQQPSNRPREGSTANSGPGENPTSTESQVAASPNTTPQSVEVRSAEPVMTSTINPPQGSGEIPGQGTLNGERYPQTRQRLLALDELKGLSAAEVQYAIDEIYARYGATFPKHPDVQRQFQKFDWYHPKPKLTFDDIDQSMSDIERENVKVLARYRAMTSRPYPAWLSSHPH